MEATLPAWARDMLADFASHSEGKGPAARAGSHGPTVRLEWREAAGMDAAATAGMAVMSLTLHSHYGFTDACAVDGSFLPSSEGATTGAAAWAVCGAAWTTRAGQSWRAADYRRAAASPTRR